MLCDLLLVDRSRDLHAERHGPLGIRLLREEHPADVAVLDDGDHRVLGGVALAEPPALRPLLGVLQGVEVPCPRQRGAVQPDGNAHLIHHAEHGWEALVLLADEEADGSAAPLGLAEEQLSRVGAADLPHLLVERAQDDIVSPLSPPPGTGTIADADRKGLEAAALWQALGHEEEGDAPRSRGRPGQPGEHHVHNVIRKALVATGDPHL